MENFIFCAVLYAWDTRLDLLSNHSVYFRGVFRTLIIPKMERFAKIVNG